LNNWSLRELKRHFDSSLFDRVLLSKDKSWVLKDNLEKYHFKILIFFLKNINYIFLEKKNY
jgi:predicted nuclease of restriction endonuclease-like (RecB) superfamily